MQKYKKEYSVGDKIHINLYGGHDATIITIDGDMALLDYDETIEKWGRNKCPRQWFNLKTKKYPKCVSLVGELTKAFWKEAK